MKRILIPVLGFLSLYCQAQDGDDLLAMHKKVSDLEGSYKTLQTDYSKININLNTEYKTRYATSYSNADNAYNLVDKIESNYTNINNNIATAITYNLMAQANSPTSSKLGFKFSDVVTNLITEQINTRQDILPAEKSRFSKILKGIVENPIVLSVSKSIPVMSTVTSLISSLSNFSTTKGIPRYKDDNPNKGLANYDIVTEQVFTSKEIQAFVTKIQPYVDFYENLNKQSISFEFNLAKLKTKYSDLQSRIDVIKAQMNKDLHEKSVNDFYMFAQSETNGFDYLKIFNSRENISMQSRMHAISNLCADVCKFHSEYQEILKDNFKNNLALLDEGKNLPNAREEMINEMKNALTKLKSETETAFVKEIGKMVAIQERIIFN